VPFCLLVHFFGDGFSRLVGTQFVKMIPAITARDVTVASIRSTGVLYPIAKYPIEMQNPLKDLRIKTDDQVSEVKVRILQNLMRLKPSCVLNKDVLRGVDPDTTVSALVALVINSEPVHQWLNG
jgi:hypothetical protein